MPRFVYDNLSQVNNHCTQVHDNVVNCTDEMTLHFWYGKKKQATGFMQLYLHGPNNNIYF